MDVKAEFGGGVETVSSNGIGQQVNAKRSVCVLCMAFTEGTAYYCIKEKAIQKKEHLSIVLCFSENWEHCKNVVITYSE